MKIRVDLSEQVFSFVRSLAPEPRHALRQSIRGLETESGNIKALEGELTGFWRLKVGKHRVIFRYVVEQGEPAIKCEYAERRAFVYEVFAEEFLKRLRAKQ